MANQQSAEDRDSVVEPDDDAPEAAPAPKKPVVRENEDDGTVSVDLGDEEQPQDRKARRGGRQAEEVARLRREAQEARDEVARLRNESSQRFQQIEQRVAQPTGDPYKDKIKAIREEQELIQSTIRTAQNLDPETAKRYRDRFYALNDAQEELAQERILDLADRRAAARQQPQQGQGEEAIMRAEFPEVIPQPGQQPSVQQLKALRWAAGEYQRLTAEDEPPTLVTSRKAMQAAAIKFGLRQAAVAPVSRVEQQRFGALPGQAGPRTGGNETHLSVFDKKLAASRWPELEEREQWVKMAALLRRTERAGQQAD